jgi:hypothetical protein
LIQPEVEYASTDQQLIFLLPTPERVAKVQAPLTSEFEMQRWQDELTKHPINTAVKQLLDFLERDLQIDDPVIEAERARFAKVVYWLADSIRRLDPDVVPFDLLSQIHNQLQGNSVVQLASNIANSRDVSQIRDLNTRIEPALSYIAQLRGGLNNAGLASADVQAATVAFESFAKSVQDRLLKLEQSASDAAQRSLSSAQSVQALHDQVKASADNFQVQLNTWATEATARFASQQSDFTDSQAKNRATYSEMIEAIKSDANEQIRSLVTTEQEEAKQRQDALRGQLEEIIVSAKGMHEKIRVLYGLTARDAVTGGHKEIADREQTAAEAWRWATVAGLAAAIIWLLYSLFCLTPVLEPERAFWLQIGKSISLTALMLSFVVYASKQAALHRVSERKARAFFLQVQAFDPFIEGLQDADKQELKKALSARIFGADDSSHDTAILESMEFKPVEKFAGLAEQFQKIFGRQG